MATQEPLPAPDSDFDILQGILVAAVIAHAAAWNIPAAEIAKLAPVSVSLQTRCSAPQLLSGV